MLEQINDILQNTVITPYTATVKLLISFLLGAVIGIERQFRRREAGMRTFTLICMGSTAAMLVSIWIPQCYPNFLVIRDVLRHKCFRVSVFLEREQLFKVTEVFMG